MCPNKIIAAGVCLLIVLATPVSFADETVMGEAENATKQAVMGGTENVIKPSLMKLVRGVVNTATGWGELFRQPAILGREHGSVGYCAGVLDGVIMTVIRTGSGVFEAVTFPFTVSYENSYDSLINPDFVWQKAE